MNLYELHRDPFTLSTDRARLDLPLIHNYLSRESYWAQGRSLDTVRKSIEHSLCFGLYRGEAQVGFARVVTDYATFAWLCDVVVLDTARGQGLGKWLIESIVAHPELQGCGASCSPPATRTNSIGATAASRHCTRPSG